MTDAPAIAVIIPLFNGGAWIGATLRSVLEQRLPPAEVIVVDDGSTDGGHDAVAACPSVRLLRNPAKGANPARVFGQAQTTAPLICFLDQDDLWHPDHLHLLTAALAEDPDAPAAVSDCTFFRDGNHPRFGNPVLDVTPFDPWNRYPATFPNSPSAALIRRSALKRVGGWPTDVTGVADFYAWLRLSECGLLCHNRYASVGRRLHTQSHGAELRSRQAVFFARNLAKAAEKATALRARAHPADADRMVHKREMVQALAGIVEGLDERDARMVSEAAVLLEHSTASESGERVRPAFEVLLWFLNLQAEPAEIRVATLSFLLASWPRTARRTARLLHDFMLPLTPSSELVRCVARHPASPALWHLLFRSVVPLDRSGHATGASRTIQRPAPPRTP